MISFGAIPRIFTGASLLTKINFAYFRVKLATKHGPRYRVHWNGPCSETLIERQGDRLACRRNSDVEVSEHLRSNIDPETRGFRGGFLDDGSAVGIYSRLHFYEASERAALLSEGKLIRDRLAGAVS